MPGTKAIDVEFIDLEGVELPFEATWFYPSIEEAREHAEELNRQMNRHQVRVIRERELKK